MMGLVCDEDDDSRVCDAWSDVCETVCVRTVDQNYKSSGDVVNVIISVSPRVVCRVNVGIACTVLH